MSKHAVILAGGKGTRLRPYTVVLPKPLMPISDYSILEIIIKQLSYYGFTNITMALNHQAEVIKALFGDGRKWDVKINYSYEEKPLSTMAPLKLIPGLPDNFLVMNGDILTDLNFNNLYEKHVSERNLFTISAFNRTHTLEYGVLNKNNKNELIDFQEKPKMNYLVSMGIYMINKKALDYIPKGKKFGFDDLMYTLLEKNLNPKIFEFSDYWMDIGRPDDYMKAIDDFEELKNRLIPNE